MDSIDAIDEAAIAGQAATKKHVILFLAANPGDTDRLALDREARAIHVELKRSGYRDRFEFVTRWAAEPLDLLRELRELKPTIVHFSGHGARPDAKVDPAAPMARAWSPRATTRLRECGTRRPAGRSPPRVSTGQRWRAQRSVPMAHAWPLRTGELPGCGMSGSTREHSLNGRRHRA